MGLSSGNDIILTPTAGLVVYSTTQDRNPYLIMNNRLILNRLNNLPALFPQLLYVTGGQCTLDTTNCSSMGLDDYNVVVKGSEILTTQLLHNYLNLVSVLDMPLSSTNQLL